MGRPSIVAEPSPLCVRVTTGMKMLGIGKTKIYELIASGDLETVRLGRRTLIVLASIETLFERLRTSHERSG